MLSVLMLSVLMLSVLMLRVLMLSVRMLSVRMLTLGRLSVNISQTVMSLDFAYSSHKSTKVVLSKAGHLAHFH
jgi:hypothetical protein